MHSTRRTYSLKLPARLVEQMPRGLRAQREIITLGLQQWRVRKALEKYRRGECTLAFAAQDAGVTLREIIPLAYAYGLEPNVDARLLEHDLAPGEAARL
jgi:aryl carrier-like protein